MDVVVRVHPRAGTLGRASPAHGDLCVRRACAWEPACRCLCTRVSLLTLQSVAGEHRWPRAHVSLHPGEVHHSSWPGAPLASSSGTFSPEKKGHVSAYHSPWCSLASSCRINTATTLRGADVVQNTTTTPQLHLVLLDPALRAGVGPMLSNLPQSIVLAAKQGLSPKWAHMGCLGAVVHFRGNPTRATLLQGKGLPAASPWDTCTRAEVPGGICPWVAPARASWVSLPLPWPWARAACLVPSLSCQEEQIPEEFRLGAFLRVHAQGGRQRGWGAKHGPGWGWEPPSSGTLCQGQRPPDPRLTG